VGRKAGWMDSVGGERVAHNHHLFLYRFTLCFGTHTPSSAHGALMRRWFPLFVCISLRDERL
jgi:hypothetical protein